MTDKEITPSPESVVDINTPEIVPNNLAEIDKIYRAKYREWQDYLSSVEKYWGNVVKTCTKEMTVFEKKRTQTSKKCEKDINAAQKAVDVAEKWGRRALGSYGLVRLFDDRVVTSQGTAFFSEGPVAASVDSAGNISVSRRPTLTRALAGGALLGPLGALGGLMATKKETADTRELYLIIEAPTFSSLLHCKPESGSLARQMALNVNAASRNSVNVEAQRKKYIDETKVALDQSRAFRDVSTKAVDQEIEEYRKNVYGKEIDDAKSELEKARLAYKNAIEKINNEWAVARQGLV